MFLVTFHICLVSVLAGKIISDVSFPSFEHNDSPNIPDGLTIVSFPKTCLQVPAINSKLFESEEVMGAGSNPDRASRVIWKLEVFVAEGSKAEIVKLRD